MSVRLLLGPVLGLVLSSCVLLEFQDAPTSVRIMSWNVENLFDDKVDGSEYPEFVPGPSWNTQLYWARLEAVARVLEQACPGGPDVVAFQEVENQAVLEALRTRFAAHLGYGYSYLVASPYSPVHPGFLSRYPFRRTQAHASARADSPKEGRHILEVEIDIGPRPLILLNNHWKSRQPSAAQTESKRRSAARVVNRRLSELALRADAPSIVVLGDFNTELGPADELLGEAPAMRRSTEGVGGDFLSIGATASFSGGGEAVGGGATVLRDLWDTSSFPGSYRFRGSWSRIDHIFLGRGFTADGPWAAGTLSVVRPSMLVREDGSPRGWSVQDREGVSDHFPLLVCVEPRP